MATLTQQKHTKPEQPNASAGASAGPQAQDTLARDHVQARAYEIFQNVIARGGAAIRCPTGCRPSANCRPRMRW